MFAISYFEEKLLVTLYRNGLTVVIVPMPYEEEDTRMSYDEEDTRMYYEEEDTSKRSDSSNSFQS